MNTFRLSWGELCGEYLSGWVINDQFQTIELQETKKRTSWRISDSFIPRRPTINTTNQRFVLSLSLCFSSSSKCFFKDLQTSPCPTNESTGKSESCYRFCLQEHLYEWKTSERTSVLHSPPFSKGKTVDSQDSWSVGVRWKFQNPQAREQRHIRASVTRTKEIETESIPAESIGNQKEILPSPTSLLSLLIDGQLSLTSPSPHPHLHPQEDLLFIHSFEYGSINARNVALPSYSLAKIHSFHRKVRWETKLFSSAYYFSCNNVRQKE